MVPAGNKAKRLLSVNHTTKKIHHHHHHHHRHLFVKLILLSLIFVEHVLADLLVSVQGLTYHY